MSKLEYICCCVFKRSNETDNIGETRFTSNISITRIESLMGGNPPEMSGLSSIRPVLDSRETSENISNVEGELLGHILNLDAQN